LERGGSSAVGRGRAGRPAGPTTTNSSCRQPQTYVKTEAAITIFEILMMSGMSLETI
jgi:hypothetical protein